MAEYLIYFDQQWVGDHSPEWFASRGPLAMAVVQEMEEAGVLVFAGGLEEDVSQAAYADARSGSVVIGDGLYSPASDYLGGLTAISVETDEEARRWAGRIAEACGWPQQLRRFGARPDGATGRRDRPATP